MNITRIGIGAWAIGGGQWEFGWRPQADEQSIAASRAGLDLGVDWIDTAAAYDLRHSETVVGRTVRDRRTRPYVFTKCSLVSGSPTVMMSRATPGYMSTSTSIRCASIPNRAAD